MKLHIDFILKSKQVKAGTGKGKDGVPTQIIFMCDKKEGFYDEILL